MNEKEKDTNKTEENREYFHLIPNSVFYDDELTDKQKLIFAEIYQLAQKSGYCFASNGYIADRLNVKPVTVSRAIAKLTEMNHIESIFEKDEYTNVTRRKTYIKHKLKQEPLSEEIRGSNSKDNTPITEEIRGAYQKSIKGVASNDKHNNISNNYINESEDIYSRADEKNDELINQIVNYLNEKTGKDFKATTKQTVSLIKARVRDGYNFDDFKKVIDTKTNQWQSKPDMNRYLRPQTLFGNKFEAYLQEYSNNNRFNNSNDINKYDW